MNSFKILEESSWLTVKRLKMADLTLDARMLNCPEPIIRTREALAQMRTGQTLRVLATDPGSVLDFQAYCRISGNELIEMQDKEGDYRFLLRKCD